MLQETLSPNITWFREGMALSSEMVNSNGTLLIMNITEGVDATREGVSYHCTANNTFGTIHSRAANVCLMHVSWEGAEFIKKDL